jgi:hypothetical protein
VFFEGIVVSTFGSAEGLTNGCTSVLPPVPISVVEPTLALYAASVPVLYARNRWSAISPTIIMPWGSIMEYPGTCGSVYTPSSIEKDLILAA